MADVEQIRKYCKAEQAPSQGLVRDDSTIQLAATRDQSWWPLLNHGSACLTITESIKMILIMVKRGLLDGKG